MPFAVLQARKGGQDRPAALYCSDFPLLAAVYSRTKFASVAPTWSIVLFARQRSLPL